MNFPFYIAKRYLFSKSKNNAINIITIIAAIGVFAGALALFIVLSGFSGLKAFSVQFTNEIDPDLKVLPHKGKLITFDSTKAEKLGQLAGIADFSKVVEERVLLSYEDRYTPAFIKGVDSHFNTVTATDQSVISGQWFDQDSQQVVIGSGIAKKLSLGVGGFGDALKLLMPKPGKGLVTDPGKAFKTAETTVDGVYNINEDLNDKYVFASLDLAKQLVKAKPDEISAIALKLSPGTKERTIKPKIRDIFGEEILIKNRIQLNDELYKMLNTENLAVYFIFTLVIIIALFNVGGAIVMAVLDKRNDIKTLFNLGATTRQIKQIFFLQGALLTILGGIIGLIAGVVLILLQQQYGMVMITQTLPYPVRMHYENMGIVLATIIILGFLASYVGATRVSKALH